jgi:hypothetical protein
MTNYSNIKLEQSELDTISTFEQNLENIFITDTNVAICSSEDNLIGLVIEIDSTFILSEVFSLLKLNLNDSYQKINSSKAILLFKNAFYTLNQSLNGNADIDELSIYFKDTSIIINSINRNSIIEEIGDIIYAVIQHHKHYSTLMGLMPNEIHIPVIEDPTTKKLFNKSEAVITPNYQSPYLQYWGMYFDSYDKPLIYNLNRTNITPGDLDLSFD